MEIPISDADWARVKHLFPDSEAPRSRTPGRPRRNVRDLLNAILWIHYTREKWHRLPSTFPPAQTCYAKYCAWRREGVVQLAIDILEVSGFAVKSKDEDSAVSQ
ncbi:transposase [Silvimonas sp.]|uniref:transposase n=1 Tax=Silvimonas sp. TaxID=2650811 RepID=UPI00386B0A6F